MVIRQTLRLRRRLHVYCPCRTMCIQATKKAEWYVITFFYLRREVRGKIIPATRIAFDKSVVSLESRYIISGIAGLSELTTYLQYEWDCVNRHH
jgi:hypothetical protein